MVRSLNLQDIVHQIDHDQQVTDIGYLYQVGGMNDWIGIVGEGDSPYFAKWVLEAYDVSVECYECLEAWRVQLVSLK